MEKIKDDELEMIINTLNINEMILLSMVNKEYHTKINNHKIWNDICVKMKFKINKKKSMKDIIIENIHKFCVDCYSEVGLKHSIFKKNICKICIEKEDYKLITKSEAKKTYLLNDKHLNELECFKKKNPVYRNAHEMCLYFEREIIEKSQNIYNNLEDEFKKREDRREKRNKTIENNKLTRKKKLIEELSKKKLKLRSDSYLCEKYINGSKEVSLEYIVDTMYEMNFLFSYTNYINILSNNINEIKDEGMFYNIEEEKEYAKDIAIDMFVMANLKNKDKKKNKINIDKGIFCNILIDKTTKLWYKIVNAFEKVSQNI